MGQRALYGEPPARASFRVHALVMMSYLRGAYYPRGGAQALADALVRAIELTGGAVRVRAEVERILLEDGRAVGVRLRTGEEVRAPVVISNADLWATFQRLIGAPRLPVALAQRLQRVEPSLSGFNVYMGTDLDLAAMGLGSEHHWYLGSGSSVAWEVPPEEDDPAAIALPSAVMVSCPSLKDPGGKMAPPGHHVLQIFALSTYKHFRPWADEPVMRRGADYEQYKQRLAQRLISFLESKLIPGLGAHCTALEVGTPLSNEHYSHVTLGACYGPALIPSQVGSNAFEAATAVPGLFLAGANREPSSAAPLRSCSPRDGVLETQRLPAHQSSRCPGRSGEAATGHLRSSRTVRS